MSHPRPTRLSCLLQPEEGDYTHVEATEGAEGLHLHAAIIDPDIADDPIDFTYWGCISLEGWQHLAEMFALRHPERFRKVVRRWKALRRSQDTTKEEIHAHLGQ